MAETKTAERLRIAPEVCSYVEEDQTILNIEISLPGVKKEDIDLRLRDDSLSLSAPREDVEYVATLAFCCPVNPDQANAEYDNGLLRIRAPFKDVMENAVKVQVK